MKMERFSSIILKKPLLLGLVAFLLNLFISTTPVLILNQNHIQQHAESFKVLQITDKDFLLGQEKITNISLIYSFVLSLLISSVIMLLSYFLKKAYMEVETLSHFDGLTGLHNRLMFLTIFEKEILRAKRNQQKLFMVILDIDDFKPINDNFGHLVGDEAIKMTAHTLKGLLRSSDTIARFGGDEFVICLADEEECTASGIINRILDEFNNKTILISKGKNTQELQINLSIGYTRYKKEDDFKTMLHRADQALYISKEAGKNTATFLA